VYRRDADHPSEQGPLAGGPGEGGEWKRLEHHPSEQRPLAGGLGLPPQQAKDRLPGTPGLPPQRAEDRPPGAPGLAELVREASYRDATVVAGRSYAYRVTAVSTAGNESGSSAEVTETAPAAASSGP
jgi:hypothetical protein